MKRFEEKLTDNITTAFDAFQEEVDPGAFKDIQSRLRKRKRKIFWFPWILRGAATVALVVGGYFIWYLYSGYQDDRQPVIDQEMAILKDDFSTGQGDDPAQISEQLESATSDTTTETYKYSSKKLQEAENRALTQKKISKIAGDNIHGPNLPVQKSQEAVSSVTSHNAETGEVVPNVPSDQPVQQLLVYQALQPLPTITPWVFSDNNIEPIFLLMSGIGVQKNETVHKESAFSLVAGIQAGLINNQVARGMGYKVGGLYQIPLKKGFGLTAGLLVSHVKLGYDPEPGTSFSLDLLEVDTSVDFPPPYEVGLEDWVDVQLWSFEIPLDLNYSWRHTNGGYYRITAGFSSFWYIQQRFETERTVYTLELDDISTTEVNITEIRKETLVEEFPSFQTFDTFSMFNFTFAFPIRLGSRHIYLEPYLQLPIYKQTSRAIRYGSGGIHVIFPFYHSKTSLK